MALALLGEAQPEAVTMVQLKILGCVLILLSLMAAPSAQALIILDSDTYLGHTYYLLSPGTWTDSEAAAVGLGGHLVAIGDAFENEFVKNRFGVATNLFATQHDLWLGLTDQAVEGTFVWSNGDPLSYTNWVLGEPNNYCPPPMTSCVPENYVHMPWWASPLGAWNDVPNVDGIYGLVEVDHVVPEPSSLLLVGLGLAGLSRARRRH
jgi:hypothetical protein